MCAVEEYSTALILLTFFRSFYQCVRRTSWYIDILYDFFCIFTASNDLRFDAYALRIQETTRTKISTVPAVRFRFLALILLENRSEPTAPAVQRFHGSSAGNGGSFGFFVLSLRKTSEPAKAPAELAGVFAEEKGDYFLLRRSFASSVVSPLRARNF